MFYRALSVCLLLAASRVQAIDLLQAPIEADVVCGDHVSGSNVGAPDLVPEDSAGDVIYRWNFTQGGDYLLDTCQGSVYDTYLYLYSDANLTDQIDKNDDYCSNYRSLVEGNLAPGVYYIAVGGFSSREGNFELSVSCGGLVPLPTLPEVDQFGLCDVISEDFGAASCGEFETDLHYGYVLEAPTGGYLQYEGRTLGRYGSVQTRMNINACILSLYGNEAAGFPTLPTRESHIIPDRSRSSVDSWSGRSVVVSPGFDWATFHSTGTYFQATTVECFFPKKVCELAQSDGNLEVLYPPLLDEDFTAVDFNGTDAFFNVLIRVPRQYETAAFSFEGAADASGGFDSENLAANIYWEIDDMSDPCHILYDGRIPWDLFRTTLGGVTRDDQMRHVSFATTIDILTTKTLTLTPETLLEMREESGNQLLQVGTEYTRTVSNKIPFEVVFETHVDLESTVHVPSNHLRVTAALLDTSVLSVETDPFDATARLEFVTVIPLPLILDHVNISVDQADLATGLALRELTAKQSCDPDGEFCTQHWEVDVFPEGCDLNGAFRADVKGRCHDARQGCDDTLLTPDTMNFTMDVRSDDFCGITQEIALSGDLTLDPAECNGLLRGRVTVENIDEGAYINHTKIISVIAYPPLENPETTLFTVFDAGASVLELNYVADTGAFNDEVNFEFEWRGADLRCDVVAEVEVVAVVVYGATRDLGAKKLLSFRGSVPQKSLLQVAGGDDASEQSLVFGGTARISADTSNVGDASASDTGAGILSSPMMIGVIAGLSALLVVLVAAIALFVRRSRNKQSADDINNGATQHTVAAHAA